MAPPAGNGDAAVPAEAALSNGGAAGEEAGGGAGGDSGVEQPYQGKVSVFSILKREGGALDGHMRSVHGAFL